MTPSSVDPAFAEPLQRHSDSSGESSATRTLSPPVAPIDIEPFAVLIATPTLEAGAADAGALELVRILSSAGHEPLVVSAGGRMTQDAEAAGATCLTLRMASRNPLTMLRNAFVLKRILRERNCRVIHAHGRGPGWSAWLAARMARVPFLTTWYKGFREQNALKRLYNSVMARGERVIAVSDQIAELVHDRHNTPWERIAVVPLSADTSTFDPAGVTSERIAAVRRAWGVTPDDRVILVTGRMLRRKGHHVVVEAAERLKAMGMKDFVVVFVGEQGTRYAGELWDRVIGSGVDDVIRMAGPAADLPAAYAAAAVVVSAAVQPEGVQRALLEAQAMACPVIVSDLGAGSDVVLAAPAVGSDRITGFRVPTGDAGALAAALVRLFSLPETERRAIGARGRSWMRSHFSAESSAALILKLYAEVASRQKVA